MGSVKVLLFYLKIKDTHLKELLKWASDKDMASLLFVMEKYMKYMMDSSKIIKYMGMLRLQILKEQRIFVFLSMAIK